MPAGQQIPPDAASPANGHTAVHDLFALTDEQILEIEPEAEPDCLAPAVISTEARNLPSSSVTDQASQSKRDSSSTSAARNDRMAQIAPDAAASSHESPVTSHVAAEQPPTWLAAQMKDPWTSRARTTARRYRSLLLWRSRQVRAGNKRVTRPARAEDAARGPRRVS